jgi:hypothetical protein
MHHISFIHKNKPMSFTAPATWNEVSLQQLLQWLIVLYGKAENETKLALSVPIFYGLPTKIYKALRPHERLQIAPTLRALFNKNTLNVWLIKSFRLHFRKYYGPADKLSNLTAHEFFNICEPLYWQYKKSGDIAKLNALCAVLYRRKRAGIIDDDIREDITDAGIGLRAKRFKSLSLNYKLAIVFNYEGCRSFITSVYPQAFEGKGGKSKRQNDVTLALAGGPLGDHPTTKKTNLYTFLKHLVNLIEQEEELKQR